MEHPTQYDLNDSIRRWRSGIAQSPAFSGQDLDELEGHLRDSVATLAQMGLTEEEAFVIAQRRLGPTERLTHEYEKAHHGRLWEARIMGFIGISLLLQLAYSLAACLDRLCLGLGIRWLVQESWQAPVGAILNTTTHLVSLGLLIWLLNKQSRRLHNALETAIDHPFTSLGLIIGLSVAAALVNAGSFVLLARTFSPSQIGSFYRWSMVPNYAVQLAFPAFLLFAARHVRNRRAVAQ